MSRLWVYISSLALSRPELQSQGLLSLAGPLVKALWSQEFQGSLVAEVL